MVCSGAAGASSAAGAEVCGGGDGGVGVSSVATGFSAVVVVAGGACEAIMFWMDWSLEDPASSVEEAVGGSRSDLSESQDESDVSSSSETPTQSAVFFNGLPAVNSAFRFL